MGQTAADTQREIVDLRLEITDAATELDKRVTEMLDVRARVNDIRARAYDARDWALRMVEEQPKAAAGAGAGVALGTALLAVNAVKARRKRKTAAARLAALRESTQGEAARLVEDAIAQARVLLAASGEGLTHLSASEGVDKDSIKSEPSMVKKLIWTALTAGSLALAGIIARKLSTSIWQAIMHEEPPTTST